MRAWSTPARLASRVMHTSRKASKEPLFRKINRLIDIFFMVCYS